MPSNNKKWFNAFNNPELKEEKWLEPSDALFDHISNEIFEKKKKRKLVYWLFGLGSFLILGVGAFMILDSEDKTLSLNGDTINIRPSQSSQNADFKSASMDNLLSNSELKAIDIKPLDANESESLKSTVSTLPAQLRNNSDNSKNRSSKRTSIYDEELYPDKVFSAKSETTIANKNAQGSQSFKYDVKEKSTISSLDGPSKASAQLRPLLSFSEINLLTFLLSSEEGLPPLLNHVYIDDPTDLKNALNNSFSLGISFGLSQWNFNLNNNYITALNPADFSFDNGRGINAGLSLEKKISSNLSFISTLQLEQIDFVSGHNSSANYDLLMETGGMMTNDIALTMATPLGFIDSEVIVNRADNTSTENTALVLDLHNDHRITNLSLDAGVSYALYKNKFINISPTVSLGANYFSSITNELSSFDIDQDGFNSGVTKITSVPQNVKTITPFVNMGLVLDREIGNNFKTGFGIAYRKTLTPIYSEGDFSTNLSSLNLRWTIAKMF